MKFNDFIKQKRLDLNYTLREFCRNKGQDTAYISRLENGIILPPKKQEKLEALAIAYGIKKDTKDWVYFFDLAATAQLSIPKDILDNNPKITEFLPAFYRTARNKTINEADIAKLINLIRGEDDQSENGDN